MRPSLSSQNLGDTKLANAENISRFLLRKLGRSNFQDLFFSQFRPMVLRASIWVCSMPVLIMHVFHVVGMSTQHKMIGINARRIVAFMHNAKFLWNGFGVFNHPRDAISQVHLSTVIINAKKTLASFIHSSFPFPAIIRSFFINFAPESIEKLFIKHVGGCTNIGMYKQV